MGASVYEDFPVSAGAPNAFSGNLTSQGFGVSKNSSFFSPKAFPVPQVKETPSPEPQVPPKPSFFDNVSLYSGYASLMFNMAGAQMKDNGFLPWQDPAPSFEEISARTLSIVKASGYKPRKYGQPSLLKAPGFVREMETAADSRFIGGNYVRYLVDGEQSFEARYRLIAQAKKNILITTWAFYDDITGFETAGMLVEKKKQGVDVKVIVDDKILRVHGEKAVKLMESAGIEVLKYAEHRRKGDYWHVKMMLVDDKYSIVGGINFGDPYSHRDPNGFKWRDTDVLYSGPAVIESKKFFAEIWNSQIAEKKLKLSRIDAGVSPNQDFEPGDAKIAVLFQNPPEDSNIFISLLKAIYGATEKINIENAYVVALPALETAILDARARGVEVNIFTNSMESIDPESKFIAVPILKSLAKFLAAGVNVYLKQGQTLHSKFMTVDGVYANIGSYNFHPRGERYDTELNVAIIGEKAAKELDAVFETDISAAVKVRTAQDLGIKETFWSSMLEKYFYSQLSHSPLKSDRK